MVQFKTLLKLVQDTPEVVRHAAMRRPRSRGTVTCLTEARGTATCQTEPREAARCQTDPREAARCQTEPRGAARCQTEPPRGCQVSD